MSNKVTEIIKNKRKCMGLNQSDMAQKLNMSRSTYAYKETNCSFTIDEFKDISKIFDISLDALTSNSISNIYQINESDYKPNFLRSYNDFINFEENFLNIITMNEIKLLRKFRNLSKENKKRLNEYIETLSSPEE